MPIHNTAKPGRRTCEPLRRYWCQGALAGGTYVIVVHTTVQLDITNTLLARTRTAAYELIKQKYARKTHVLRASRACTHITHTHTPHSSSSGPLRSYFPDTVPRCVDETHACLTYMAASCSGVVASQSDLSGRLRIKRGKRRERPRSECTSPDADRCTGDIVTSAPRISHTSCGSNQNWARSPVSTPSAGYDRSRPLPAAGHIRSRT